METLDIVDLIEKNPVVILSENSNDKLLKKIKERFSDEDQKIFISSFYCYLKYDQFKDFVVDLDDVWEWMGFARKDNAKRTLEKFFHKQIDYKLFAPLSGGAKKGSGGHNSLKTLMCVNTFKSLCLRANTSKASKIHEYYIKLETIIHEVLNDNQSELIQQVALLKNEKEEYIKKMQKDAEEEAIKSKLMAEKAAEKATILQFPLNTECVYVGKFTNKNQEYIKYGQTNNLNQRVRDHRKYFGDFILVNAFKVQNKVEIENVIRRDERIKPYEKTLEVNGKTYKEILLSGGTSHNNGISIDYLFKTINDIVKSRSCTLDNFNRILSENEEHVRTNDMLRHEIKMKEHIIEEQRCEIKEYVNKLKIANISKLNAEDKMIKIIDTVAPNHEYNCDNDNEDLRDWVHEHCVIEKDAEVCGRELIGWFRITKKNKDGALTEKFKDYLKCRFKQGRLKNTKSSMNGNLNGYFGIKLREINHNNFDIPYNTREEEIVTEFIKTKCEFNPKAKILMSEIMDHVGGNGSRDNIISYLIKRRDVFYSNLSYKNKTGVGFYGFCIKGEVDIKVSPTTAKSVEKVCNKTGSVLGKWDTITNAASKEEISRSKLFRFIQNKKVFTQDNNEYYYAYFRN